MANCECAIEEAGEASIEDANMVACNLPVCLFSSPSASKSRFLLPYTHPSAVSLLIPSLTSTHSTPPHSPPKSHRLLYISTKGGSTATTSFMLDRSGGTLALGICVSVGELSPTLGLASTSFVPTHSAVQCSAPLCLPIVPQPTSRRQRRDSREPPTSLSSLYARPVDDSLCDAEFDQLSACACCVSEKVSECGLGRRGKRRRRPVWLCGLKNEREGRPSNKEASAPLVHRGCSTFYSAFSLLCCTPPSQSHLCSLQSPLHRPAPPDSQKPT